MQKWSPRWVVGGTAVLTFLLYWLTMPRDLTWQAFSGDGGELITAAVTLGVPHPPGYPTYVLLGKLISFLPIEPVAYRFHLFSALCTAGAAGLVTATVFKLSSESAKSSSLLASVPGLLFAFSPLVWQQAVVAEVYSLNLLLVAAFLWALLGKQNSLFIGYLLGLSFTTHLTSLFLIPLTLLHTPRKAWGKLAIGASVGAAPFLLLPLLARQGSPVVWGDPTTLAGWWWLVSGKIYQPNQFALPLTEFWPRLSSWLPEFALQLGILGWAVLVWYGRSSLQQKKWLGLVGTAVCYLIYAFCYNTQDAIMLTLPAWLLFSLCLIPILPNLGKRELFLPPLAVLLHLASQTGANIHNIRPQAEAILASAPLGAVLITSGDPDIFVLWYFHHAEGMRDDIILVEDLLFAFDWYREAIGRQQPTLRALEEDNLSLFETVNASQHAICHVRLLPEPTIDCLQDNE